MKKRMSHYLRETDAIIGGENSCSSIDWAAFLAQHLQQIAFFQHERLIHLLVTLAFGAMTMAVGILLYCCFCLPLCALFLALLCLLIPYIFHYFFLENGVQKMYQQYDEICSIMDQCRQQSV